MADLGTEAAAGDPAASLIDGHFAVDFAAPLPDGGGGQPAFAVQSLRSGPGFMAVQAELGWPVRAAALAALSGAPIANLLMPLAHGAVPMPSRDMGYFVVCQAPPGRPLARDLRPWPEAELIDMLMRPAAVALAELHGREATHRAIRLDNLFHAGPSDPVTLGCAWAAPPASRQPSVYEPPYAAMCLPAGRGNGAPADDIYALGVLLIALALGRLPMAGMDEEAVLRAKLESGSYDALVGRAKLPNAVAELARSMLADDPEHRPSAVLLGDPVAARARRAASRPQRRAQRPFAMGASPLYTARDLAHALVDNPDRASAQLRNGAIGTWLRRSVGDGTMASRMDEVCALRDQGHSVDDPRADAVMTACAVAVLDPLAPLAWRRLALWPDGLGPALNQALQTDPAQALALTEIVTAEVPLAYGPLRPGRSDMARLKAEARRMQPFAAVKPQQLAALRLNYALNPLAPCESPLLAGRWVYRLADILPALERAAAGPLRTKALPVDRHIAAFVAARRDERAQADLGALANLAAPADALAQLRLLARLQERTQPGKLPALTEWMAEAVMPATAKFQSQTRREAFAKSMAEVGKSGMLPTLASLVEDQQALTADKSGHQSAINRGIEIDIEMRALQEALAPRQRAAVKMSHDITSSISLAACGLALAAAVFL